jgi:hypothetical protein
MDIPCTINGVQVMVLFDIGTNISVVDPQERKILMAFETEAQNRIGVIQSAVIRAGKYSVTTKLKVESFSRDKQFS